MTCCVCAQAKASPQPPCCESELCLPVDGLLLLWNPCWFLLDELVAFMQKVASEAPEVPFYYYHIPPLTGVKSKYRVQIFGDLLSKAG